MEIAINILEIIICVLSVFWLFVIGWQLVIGLIGFLPLGNKFRKKQGKVQRTHRFAALICARNEERVIGQLIDSLKRQNYPAECLDIFVVADNCSDDTAGVARRAGAHVFTRADETRVGKGYALKFAVDRLHEQYPDKFDALAIFDADNLVDEDFFWSVNRALCDDADVVIGNRMAKNPYDTWVSGCYAIFWNIAMRLFDESRNKAGLSCFVHGTGFVTRMELIKNGWETTSIAEDGEFAVIHKCAGRRIVYIAEAEYYDEQPTLLKHFVMQFYRWEVGAVQSLRSLFKRICSVFFRRPGEAIDGLTFLLLPAALSALIFSSVLGIVLTLLASPLQLQTMLLLLLIYILIAIVPVQLLALYAAATSGLSLKKLWKSVAFFPLFTLPMSVVALCALIRPKAQWRTIPHTDVSGIDDIARRGGK